MADNAVMQHVIARLERWVREPHRARRKYVIEGASDKIQVTLKLIEVSGMIISEVAFKYRDEIDSLPRQLEAAIEHLEETGKS